ncbi:hypothetical protein PAL_GLEAN10006812 [Pteropus alecto]|uniref:Uncharacterized protein n=1 Tax=Pteropus alecto TaxID=9402 RepID=L5L5L8_PTEAL|nr:hypothetical protein PAL_GLEAN10006812 [Pteropus alecto]
MRPDARNAERLVLSECRVEHTLSSSGEESSLTVKHLTLPAPTHARSMFCSSSAPAPGLGGRGAATFDPECRLNDGLGHCVNEGFVVSLQMTTGPQTANESTGSQPSGTTVTVHVVRCWRNRRPEWPALRLDSRSGAPGAPASG